MDRGLVTLIGMSIAYAASFLGMGLAYYAWRKRRQRADAERAAEGRASGMDVRP